MLIDAAMGLALLVGLAILMGVMTAQSRTHMRTLRDQRAALEQARQVLHDMQVGLPGAWADRLGRTVHIAPVSIDPPTPGMLWIEVIVERGQAQAKLTGLAPIGAATRAREGER